MRTCLAIALSALFITSPALADVPLELSHQGRLLDSAGSPLDGSYSLGFALYTSPAGGSALWSETQALDFDNGYFSATLGLGTPLPESAFDGGTLYLGLTVDGGAELPGRQPIGSVPYAVRAGNAASVTGGAVDASSVKVNGTTVIDSSGKIAWTSISGAPNSDTLADLDCDLDQIARYNGSSWACAAADDHGHLASDILSGIIDIGRLPVGTTADTIAAGDHTHSAAELGALEFNQDGSAKDRAGQSCKTIHTLDPSLPSGLYWLDPDGDGDTADAWQAWCDMRRNGGGWTLVIQNNRTVTTSTNPEWADTLDGALVRGGSLGDNAAGFDVHVGLNEWRDLGTEGRVEMGTVNGKPERQALYGYMTVDPGRNYTLRMRDEVLTLGTGSPGIFTTHADQPWTTTDRDNDASAGNCSNDYHHPWWYTACWSGSIWGSEDSHQPAPFWTGSGGDHWAWGAVWLR